MTNPLRDLTQDELECECIECDNEFGCGDCSIMEEIQHREMIRARDLTDGALQNECDECKKCATQPNACKCCQISKELDYRDGRPPRSNRDVYHNGSIIKGGGVSRPEWMDDDQWGEYRMGAEYAYEVSYQGFDEPDDDDLYD